ncbi:MAG: type II toxin-antitoxin system HicB family antitoxin [Elusimicrobia bacterium]|nr:type II toxin-antitoxin system HicB family antitoxin [Elusimicrobiota bacterium]
MLSEFITKKLNKAKYKLLKDGSYFGEIPGIKGVWASANNLEDCRRKLQEVLEDWLVLKIAAGEKIPGFNLKIDKRLSVKYA